MRIKNLPAEERPVEKCIAQGCEVLSNAELLAVLIGSGTREKSAIALSEEILAGFGGVTGLMKCAPEELMKLTGVGEKKAARILASLELGRRIATAPEHRRIRIQEPDDIARLFMEELRYEEKEQCRVLLLNVKMEMIGIETVSIGALAGTPVNPREVFGPAVKRSAASVCVVHNHPSGDPTPSKEDLTVTLRLQEAGSLLGIELTDHIIIGDGRFISLRTQGYIT